VPPSKPTVIDCPTGLSRYYLPSAASERCVAQPPPFLLASALRVLLLGGSAMSRSSLERCLMNSVSAPASPFRSLVVLLASAIPFRPLVDPEPVESFGRCANVQFHRRQARGLTVRRRSGSKSEYLTHIHLSARWHDAAVLRLE